MLPFTSEAQSIEPHLKTLDPALTYSVEAIIETWKWWKYPIETVFPSFRDALLLRSASIEKNKVVKLPHGKVGVQGCYWQGQTPAQAFLERNIRWIEFWDMKTKSYVSLSRAVGSGTSPMMVSKRMVITQEAVRRGHDLRVPKRPAVWKKHNPFRGAQLSFEGSGIKPDGLYSLVDAAHLFRGHQITIRSWLYTLAASNHFPPNGDIGGMSVHDGLIIPEWTGERWLSADPNRIEDVFRYDAVGV